MNKTTLIILMAHLTRIALWGWSAMVLLYGLLTWLLTLGTVESTRFGLQISLLNHLSMLMVWAALYAYWRSFGARVLAANAAPAPAGPEGLPTT